jgi:hypothetical protein
MQFRTVRGSCSSQCKQYRQIPFPKEKTNMKQALLVVSTAILFLSALATPTIVRADGGGTGSGCGTTICVP